MFKRGWTDDFKEGSANVVTGALILGLGVPLAIAATAAIGFPLIPDVLSTREAVSGIMAV